MSNSNFKFVQINMKHLLYMFDLCADPETFVRGGPYSDNVVFLGFLVDERREDPNTTKSGPSSSFCWGVMMAQH